MFSENEPTALVQHEGGPCAVIAPVQAYLLKNAIFNNEKEWRQFNGESMLSGSCSIAPMGFMGMYGTDEEGSDIIMIYLYFVDERRQMLLIAALRDILVQCSINGFIITFSISRTSNEISDKFEEPGINLSEADSDSDNKNEISIFHSSIR